MDNFLTTLPYLKTYTLGRSSLVSLKANTFEIELAASKHRPLSLSSLSGTFGGIKVVLSLVSTFKNLSVRPQVYTSVWLFKKCAFCPLYESVQLNFKINIFRSIFVSFPSNLNFRTYTWFAVPRSISDGLNILIEYSKWKSMYIYIYISWSKINISNCNSNVNSFINEKVL